MSWLLSLQDASFKGVVFDCLSTDDAAARDVATYAYPYVDGADTEDMGSKPREFSLTAVFFGSFYETQLNAFLAKLEEPGPGELVHPVFGSFPEVQLLNHRVAHDAEHPDYATVQLSFVAHKSSNPFFSQTSSQFDGLLANIALAQGWLAAIAGYSEFASGLISNVVGGGLGMISQVSSLRNLTGGVMTALRFRFPGSSATSNDYVATPAALGTDLQATVSGLADHRTFDTAAMTDWRLMMADAQSITALPGQVASGAPVPGVNPEVVPIAAADLGKVDSLVTLAVANDVADTATQLLTEQTQTPTLSPAEIETITADARTLINAAIAKHRAAYGSVLARDVTEPLKSAAKALQDLAVTVIDARPPLIGRPVQAPGNLHLLAFKWYGDYTRAAEVLRLNPQLRNPNDLTRGEVLNAYAK